MTRLVAAAALVLLAACGDGANAPKGKSFQACGLPTPRPNAKSHDFPDGFLLEGSEPTRVEVKKDRFSAAVNVPLSVQDAYDRYMQSVKDAGFELVGRDNEGFEAEIYLKRGKQLAAVQIRMSRCDDKTIAFVNVLAEPPAPGG